MAKKKRKTPGLLGRTIQTLWFFWGSVGTLLLAIGITQAVNQDGSWILPGVAAFMIFFAAITGRYVTESELAKW